MLANYTGVYGSWALGNVSISLSESCETCLYMEYGALGQYILLPTENEHVFFGYNRYVTFYYTTVVFSGRCSGVILYNLALVLFQRVLLRGKFSLLNSILELLT